MNKVDFKSFKTYFPEVELPITLSDENVVTFSSENKALPAGFIAEYIQPIEKEIDELTEFIPCLKIPNTENYTALIYWKGSLMKYEFILVTYDKNNRFICRRSIASVIVDGDLVKKSVASIDEDLIISIIAGENQKADAEYDPKNSKAFTMEILGDGEVIFSADS